MGRMVALSADWGKGKYEEYVSAVVADRPQHRERINERIEETLSIVRRYDPYDLLAALAGRNVFVDARNYVESSQENKLFHAEYAQSLILSQALDSPRERPPAEVLKRFDELVSGTFDDVCWYYGSEAFEVERPQQEKEIRHLSLLRHLLMRGDSYPDHHYDLVRGLFSPHDLLLKEHYGFTTEEVIACIVVVIDQIEENLHRCLSNLRDQSMQLQTMFEEYIRERTDHSSGAEELRTSWAQLPGIRDKVQEFEAAQRDLGRNVFAVKPSAEAPERILAVMSAQFGDNEAFASFEKAPGWPANDSVVNAKPLIFHDGNYHCFIPQLLMVNAVGILESLIQEKDKAYFGTSYYKRRAEYLEESALKYLSDLLPGAEVFSNLFYHVEENGQRKRAETDGIVLYDNNLFIVEAKAGSLSPSTRRGGLERTRRDLKELIEKAYEQAARTKRFITDNSRPVFEYEDGSEALVLEDEDKFDNIFLINVTLESLQHLSTHLSSLRTFDFIKGQEWPWSVFINDLRVISELVETPSEFLVFLKRRIRTNDYPQFRTVDELDFLMYFFNEGLYFEDDYLKDVDVLHLTGYTDELDLYYEYLRGRVPSGLASVPWTVSD